MQLSDVGWGKIFTLGWKLLSFFKFLALSYCVMMLLQNCVNLGMSQLIGEVTKSLNAVANPTKPGDSTETANTAKPPPNVSRAAKTDKPPEKPLSPEEAKSHLLSSSVFWATANCRNRRSSARR